MTRLELRVKLNPAQADIFVRYRTTNGYLDWVTAIIDTGAQVTVLPLSEMDRVPHRITPRGRIAVEQAGIAGQSFEVIEAYMTVFLEDFNGEKTTEFETIIWFTDTEQPLLGMEQMLDRAVLHLDMPDLAGYLEFPD